MRLKKCDQFLALFFLIFLPSCASDLYKKTPDGKFSGTLDVRWVKNDYFVFIPNEKEPLTFTRKDGAKITPKKMYTDGGSIPMFLWGVKGFSPWGYAPAYIVHDWLFEAQHCGYEPDNKFSFDDSVSLMAEAMKAVMETSPEVRSYFVFDSVVTAIGSPIAEKLWYKGNCDKTFLNIQNLPLDAYEGELLMTIKY